MDGTALVECYAGYRGGEEPRRFFWREGSVEVEEILERWRSPDHRGFLVLGGDGRVYALRHYSEGDRWEIEERPRRLGGAGGSGA